MAKGTVVPSQNWMNPKQPEGNLSPSAKMTLRIKDKNKKHKETRRLEGGEENPWREQREGRWLQWLLSGDWGGRAGWLGECTKQLGHLWYTIQKVSFFVFKGN